MSDYLSSIGQMNSNVSGERPFKSYATSGVDKLFNMNQKTSDKLNYTTTQSKCLKKTALPKQRTVQRMSKEGDSRFKIDPGCSLFSSEMTPRN
jgi:hypothetical protein